MKKKLTGYLILIMLTFQGLPSFAASPWTAKPRYRDQIEGKFVFGLKHTLFSWMNPWPEANDPQYETQWSGFCVGIGKAVVYTAAGMIQLVTFPIPVDFPDIGLGMHIPANSKGFKEKKSLATAKNLKSSKPVDPKTLPPEERATPAPAGAGNPQPSVPEKSKPAVAPLTTADEAALTNIVK